MKTEDKPGRYWLTPPAIYNRLNEEFRFDFDPCPCPRPEGYNSLVMEWGQSNYCNPPFRKHDGVDGLGPTAFVHKAIEENKKGKTVVLTLPVQSYVNLLLEAGAELRSLGRVKWLEADTKEPMKGPSPICCFVLRGKNTDQHTMKTKEEILKHHLRHIQFEQSDLTFANVCQAMEEYASQQLSALQQENEKLRKYRSVCVWVPVRNEEDLPPRHIEDNTGDITYVTKIMHDDGRGGSHIEELTRDGIWEASQSEDGRVYWLDENILKP